MGSGHSVAIGMQDDPYLTEPSQADSDINLPQGMEIGSQPTNANLELPQQSLQHVIPEDITDTNLEQGSPLKIAIMRGEPCQPKDIAHSSDKSSATVSEDLAIPDCVSKANEEPQVTEPEIDAVAKPYHNVRAMIRKDLQSGLFEIPRLEPVQNIHVSAENLAKYQFPPASMPSSSHSRHRQRFDRSALLPDSNLPFCAQVMEHVKDWAEWGTRIADEQRRKEVLDHVFDVLSKAWFEALRLGYNPGTPNTKPTAPQVSTKRSAPRADVVPAGLPRGKPRSKRETSPSRKLVLVANHRDGPAWAITAGELEEAGVSESQMRKRAAAKNTLEDGEELLKGVLQDLGGAIQPSDWHKIMDVTRLNPLGRDLMVYCLYEVLKLRHNLAWLWDLYDRFPTARQKDNTKRRIDNDQELHDLFMALALELNNENPSRANPTASNPSTTREGSVVVPPATNENEMEQSNQSDVLVRLAEMILDGTDVASISSSFQCLRISHDHLVISHPCGGTVSSRDRCKRVLRDLRVDARDWLRMSEEAEAAVEQDTNVDFLRTQVQKLELEILERKETLKNLLPSLMAERETTAKSLDRIGASVEEDPAAASTATAPTDDMPVTEATSRASSPNTAKHPLDIADEEAPLPPTKRPKTDHEKEKLDHRISTLDDRQVSHDIPEVATSNNEDNLDACYGSRSDMVDKVTHHIVRLRIQSHFSPTDFTSKRVFCHPRGFKYRYTSESTLAQRRSMGDILETYVRAATTKYKDYNPSWRFGKYQAVAHMGDPQRTSVIHGIWDLETGDQPEGFEWFYRGDGTQPSKLEEASLTQDVKDEEAMPVTSPPPPPKPKNKYIVRLNLRTPSRLSQGGSRSTANDASGINTSAQIKTSGTAGPQGKSKKQGKGGYKHVRFNPQQPAVAHMDTTGPISVDRPKRRTAQRRSYAEEDEDDDYYPSE
ncbi:hypothetical protein CLAIMM_13376 [Cladophialophora immunda]|nr:hypothetical protein CLAIMM_13376 [Cladophialophora immunda]